ncbi:MAG: metal ABC transporter substrate-binding protein [Bacillota bacterium]
MNKKIIIMLIFSMVLLQPMITSASAAADVYISIYPIYEIAERLGGERLNIHQVVPEGVEVHGYEPSPRVLAKLEKSDLFVYVGENLEGWGESTARNLRGEKVDTIKLSEYVELIEYEEEHGYEEEVDDSHEDEDDHDVYDNHIWLDVDNMKIIADLLVEEFISLDPAGEEIYLANLAEVKAELEEVDQAYRESLQDLEHDIIIVSHAAFGYLAENYGFKQLAVTGLDPHSEPSSRTISDLIDIAEETGVEYIFMETLASPRAVRVIAEEADLEVLTLNTAASLRPKDIENGENYFTIMYDNLENLQKALQD